MSDLTQAPPDPRRLLGGEIEAEADVTMTINGEVYRWHGPITGVAWNQEPTQDWGPSGFWEFLPGPEVDLTLTFKAHELEKEGPE